MSETPVPYNPFKNQPKAIAIAHFLDSFLRPEILNTVRVPSPLKGDYFELSPALQEEWFEFAFYELFRGVTMGFSDYYQITLTVTELGLIKRRIVNFLKGLGYKHPKG